MNWKKDWLVILATLNNRRLDFILVGKYYNGTVFGYEREEIAALLILYNTVDRYFMCEGDTSRQSKEENKVLKKVYIVVLVLGLVACSTVGIKYNYRPETSTFSVPELGVVSTAGLGEPLLDKGNVTKTDVLYVVGRSRFSNTTAIKYVIESGKFYKTGEDDDFEYFKQDKTST
jgi:hypothetical protein